MRSRPRSALAVLVALGASLVADPAAPVATAQGGRPNVVILVTDDQRARGTLGVMTALERLFRDGGTEYTQAFATTPLCCPSRASIMTGRYAHNHGTFTNGEGQGAKMDQQTTLQYYLDRAGYRTGLFGKYFNKWPIDRKPPYFDEWAYFSFNNPYYGGEWNVNGDVRDLGDVYTTDFIGESAIDFIRSAEEQDDDPWFLWLAPSTPHWPAIADPEAAAARLPAWQANPAVREQDRSDKPPAIQRKEHSPAAGRIVRRRQLRSLIALDETIASLYDEIDRLGEGNTIAFFVSDNGILWGEHGLLGKRTPYSPSIRIPMLARWPGHIAAGARDARLTANIDVAPTILAAAGIDPATEMDGRPLQDEWTRERLLIEYWKTWGEPTPKWASTRTRRYQYIEYFGTSSEIRPTYREYYDLAKDPWQLVNLLGDDEPANDPDLVTLTRLSAQLSLDRSCSADTCP